MKEYEKLRKKRKLECAKLYAKTAAEHRDKRNERRRQQRKQKRAGQCVGPVESQQRSRYG